MHTERKATAGALEKALATAESDEARALIKSGIARMTETGGPLGLSGAVKHRWTLIGNCASPGPVAP